MADSTPIIVKKKRPHGGHGHHGGSWKVAYADFVTAMMAFFMVMWIMGLSEETRTIIQGYFNDPLGFAKNEPRSRSVIKIPGFQNPKKVSGVPQEQGRSDRQRKEAEARALAGKLVAAMRQTTDPELLHLLKNVEIRLTQDGLQVQFLESAGDAFFEIGSAHIKPAARRLIGLIGPVLAHSRKLMYIDGHTDARPLRGPAYSNWDLSGDRALAFRRALARTGVGERQVISVRGFADTRLRKRDDPYHYSNRRVSLLIPYEVNAAGPTVAPSRTDGNAVAGVEPVAIAPRPSQLGIRPQPEQHPGRES
jgi:chemotaxis protein MotB